ncbi:MAG: amidohydrolase [Lachnospiraceae bacterium]|nr:amidohydrolase [Lachnospiraceae bacterium]
MAEIYFGGDIITMEQEADHPESLLVSDGKIAFVGALAEARRMGEALAAIDKKPLVERDLKGKTLMPSFIDPHGHISLAAQFSAFCSLAECTTFDQIVTALKEYKEKNRITADGMIVGNSYDHNFLEEQAHPTKAVLDQVSTEIPVFVMHTSGHMGVANSALLRLAGLTDDTPDPEGGRYGRDQDGNLNGYVEETPAMTKVLLTAFPRMKGDYVQQILDAQQTYLKYGITTIQDGAAGYQAMQGLAGIAGNHLLKLDVISYVMTNELEQTVSAYREYFQTYQNRLKIGGAKIVLDGSPQGKSAWLSKPYEGEADYCAYPTHPDEEVYKAAKAAVQGKYQLLAHCNGDAASEQYIDCYTRALEDVTGIAGTENISEKSKELDLRPVMIHCQTVRDDQLDRMAILHMIPSIFVAHTYYWGDIHLKNLGPVRGAHISPARAALERGLVYNFHQDPPVVKQDMMHTVWCAVNRITRKGQSIGADQRIGVYDALKGVTINGAYEYHEENEKGSLRAGKLADMVILDQNPLKIDKMKLAEVKVLATIKEGEIVYQV